jgi:hypothetical protein
MQSIPMRANTSLTSHTPEPLSGAGSRRSVKPLSFATATIASSTKPTTAVSRLISAAGA